MSEKEHIISRIITLANSKFPQAEVYLYGSQARGEVKPFSDWDLLILLNLKTVPFETETKLMDDFYDLELETGAIISPLIYSKNDWHANHLFTALYQNIRNEGVKLK